MVRAQQLLSIAISFGAMLCFTSCGTSPQGAGDSRLSTTTAARLGVADSGNSWDQGATARAEKLLHRPLTPESAVEIALLQNQGLRATIEEVAIAEAERREASTPRNPTLSSSVRWPHSGGGSNPEFGIAGDVLSWILLPLSRKLAAREYEITSRRITNEVLTTALEAKAAFYEAQGARQLAGKTRDIAAVMEASADIARRLHEAGNINDLELTQQQALAQQTQLDVKQAEAEAESARIKLARKLGVARPERIQISGDLPAIPSSFTSLAAVEALASDQREDLAAARLRTSSINQALRLKQKSRWLPGLELGVNTEREVDGEQLTGPTLDIELPLFDRGQNSIRKLEAELRQSDALALALELSIRNDVQSAYHALKSARATYQHLASTLLPARQKILKETLLQYNAMHKSNFELLLAKEEDERAEESLINAARDYWVAYAELEKSAGGTLKKKPSSAKADAGKASPNHDSH